MDDRYQIPGSFLLLKYQPQTPPVRPGIFFIEAGEVIFYDYALGIGLEVVVGHVPTADDGVVAHLRRFDEIDVIDEFFIVP